ncbi:hypothetical protein BH20ACT15_BH20ACT15_04560 [soil metagenome]
MPSGALSRLRSIGAWIAARPGGAAIVCLGICWGITMHSMGWAQLAHYAQVRAFADGQAEIDPWHWETKDKAFVDGHFYSVKSPGVAAISLPAYLLADTGPGRELDQAAIENARKTKYPRWTPPPSRSPADYGFDPARADSVLGQVERNAPVIWLLTLIVAVIPATLLLFGVRWAGDRIQPGYGTAAAITLGLATIVATFAAEYFSHVIAAALGFGAFALLMRERDGPPSIRMVALAGLAAGLGVTFEYQVGLVGVVLFFYALAREAPRLPRAGAFFAAALAGAIPALAFNVWAFGSPFEFAYGSAVDVSGFTGHDVVGLNDDGLFGITLPSGQSAVDLLLGSRGLLALTPVIAAAIAGVWLIWRDGEHRAEVVVVAAIAGAYFLYNVSYWLPYGGGTPGPRFLIPALPFMALGLAAAYRRLPAITLSLAIPSFVFMGAAAISFPLIGDQGSGEWGDFIEDGHLEHTLLSAFGVRNPWVAIAPVVLLAFAAIFFAARATPTTRLGDLRPAVAALAAWALLSAVGPSLTQSPVRPLDGDPNALVLIAIGAGCSLLALGAIGLREHGGLGGSLRPLTRGAEVEQH